MSISCCIMAFNRSIATELFQKVANLHSQEFKFKPSEYQQALIDFIMAGSGNGIVQAVAGSGKTTTIMQGLNEIRKTYGTNKPKINATAKTVQFGKVHFRTGTTHGICNASAKGHEWKNSKGKKQKGYQIYAGKINYILQGAQFGKSVWIENQNGKKYKYQLQPTPPLLGEIEENLKEKLLNKVYVSKDDEQLYKQIMYKVTSTLSGLVGICKNTGMGMLPSCPMTLEQVQYLYSYYDKRPFMNDDIEEYWKYIEPLFWDITLKALEINNKMLDVWDFNDMFYLTALYNIDLPKYDYVFIDECQDTNPVTQALVMRMLKTDKQGKIIGRAIAVGDKAQAIYGFRGADSQAMASFTQNFKATVLPLSTCYRCAKSIVNLVSDIDPSSVWQGVNEDYPPFDYSQIEALPNAPHGLISGIIPTRRTHLAKLPDSLLKDLFTGNIGVVCRKKQPLFTIATLLLTKGIPFIFLGRSDIGKKLIQSFVIARNTLGKSGGAKLKKANGQWAKYNEFYYSLSSAEVDPFLQVYKDYMDAKIEAMKMENPTQAQKLQDEFYGVEFICNQIKEQFKNVYALSEENFTAIVNDLFNDNSENNKPVLCSVHKSKGLEFHRVIIPDLGDSFLLPFIVQPQWVEQEYNMLYVAYTRAERELVFVSTKELESSEIGESDGTDELE